MGSCAAWSGIWLLAWLLLRRRKPCKWPLIVALLPAALLAAYVAREIAAILISAVFGIVGTIGITKFIINAVGRGGALRRSELRTDAERARPEGLVR